MNDRRLIPVEDSRRSIAQRISTLNSPISPDLDPFGHDDGFIREFRDSMLRAQQSFDDSMARMQSRIMHLEPFASHSLLDMFLSPFERRHYPSFVLDDFGHIDFGAMDNYIKDYRSDMNSLYEVDEKGGLNFRACYDVSKFRPENVDVQINDNILTVKGQEESRSSDGATCSKMMFQRMCTIPSGFSPSDVQCERSSEGVLIITAPARPERRYIPDRIQHEHSINQSKSAKKDVFTYNLPIERIFTDDNIDVTATSNCLKVSATQDSHGVLSEFVKTIKLDKPIDADMIRWQLKNHILHIEVPYLH